MKFSYGIVESVFKVQYARQVFYEPVRTDGHDDGIRFYLKVVNELGPDQQTQFGYTNGLWRRNTIQEHLEAFEVLYIAIKKHMESWNN
jgi:hypothetical protein